MSNIEEEKEIRYVCPTADELSVIINKVRCEQCNLVFRNEPRFRMHDLKVHKHQKLNKSTKEHVRYHCPAESCIYALKSQKYFTLYKYLKQHYLKVHAEKIFACIRCPKSFSTEAAKEAHTRICGMSFICDCKKSFTSYEALLTHARRHMHKIDEKYKTNRGIPCKTDHIITPFTNNTRKNIQNTSNPESTKGNNVILNVHILPKPSCNVAIQTDDIKRARKISSPLQIKLAKPQVCQQTQTNYSSKENKVRKSAETQTVKGSAQFNGHHIEKRRKVVANKSGSSAIGEELSLVDNFSSENLFPSSLLPLHHDVGLQDFWEEKSSSGTQTTPDKNLFGDLVDYDDQGVEYSFGANSLSRSDPMLTEETYSDRFSSIETQTERAFCRSLFESDSISSNNETQTTESFDTSIETLHIYSNTYTQTCDEILPSDLVLSHIQTQTAWTNLEDTTVSTETQTKASKCQSGCTDPNDCRPWFTTQTNHMETQTDLLHIFQVLQ